MTKFYNRYLNSKMAQYFNALIILSFENWPNDFLKAQTMLTVKYVNSLRLMLRESLSIQFSVQQNLQKCNMNTAV